VSRDYFWLQQRKILGAVNLRLLLGPKGVRRRQKGFAARPGEPFVSHLPALISLFAPPMAAEQRYSSKGIALVSPSISRSCFN
jgi:hypothetical protein